VHDDLWNMLISADQSQRVSQPVSQITLSQFRILQITHEGTFEKQFQMGFYRYPPAVESGEHIKLSHSQWGPGQSTDDQMIWWHLGSVDSFSACF